MKPSSIGLMAAAVLTLASFDTAAAGGWIGGGRPTFFPRAHMVAPPMIRAAGRFGPIRESGFHHDFGHPGRFFPFAGAPIVFAPPVYGVPPEPYAVEPSGDPVILTPINVTIVGSGQRCLEGDSQFATGGPRIIEIGPQPSALPPAKMPTVIYGSRIRRGC